MFRIAANSFLVAIWIDQEKCWAWMIFSAYFKETEITRKTYEMAYDPNSVTYVYNLYELNYENATI